MITDTDALAEACRGFAGEPYVAVDTEFMRESTYWPRLCLVQVGGAAETVLIDPLADGIDLAPLFALMADTNIIKVLHAARQDLEIFLHLAGVLPTPLYDTQVAAMVCGFGDQVAYDALVTKLTGKTIDKGSRFTDWSLRPLSDNQLSYAAADVIHLRPVYEKLLARIGRTGREAWVRQEMDRLTEPSLYLVDPAEAWRRLKLRNPKPQFLNVLRELAAFREVEARGRDVPRNRLVRDEALVEIASRHPETVADLARTRGVSQGLASGAIGRGLIEAVQRGLKVPTKEAPKLEPRPKLPEGTGAAVDLLKVLLRLRCEAHGVAAKLVATVDDLEQIAAFGEAAETDALTGWRGELFGADALRLVRGELALSFRNQKIVATAADAGAGDGAEAGVRPPDPRRSDEARP
ncbi:MAG: ribonuclease D [Alphaproteobacteria bacterium]